jgi:hypothetical protein
VEEYQHGNSSGAAPITATSTANNPAADSIESNNRRYKYHTYEIEAGFLKEEAIELFQQFYTMENQRAPEEKRKRRREKDSGREENTA